MARWQVLLKRQENKSVGSSTIYIMADTESAARDMALDQGRSKYPKVERVWVESITKK